MRADTFIKGKPQDADPLKESVKRAERTDIPAERPVDEHGGYKKQYEEQDLPAEQKPDSRADASVKNHQRNTGFQRARGTDVFAEERNSRTVPVPIQQGECYDCYKKHCVFQIAQFPIGFFGDRDLWHGNPVEKFLNKSEQAQPSAHESADQYADICQKAKDIESRFAISS